MTIDISEVTCNSLKTRSQLLAYCNRIKAFPSFDDCQLVKVFVNSDKDFTAFESCDYAIQFTSTAHKMQETIDSKFSVPAMPFKVFFSHLLAL